MARRSLPSDTARLISSPLALAAIAFLLVAVPASGQPAFSPTPGDTRADEPMLVPPSTPTAGESSQPADTADAEPLAPPPGVVWAESPAAALARKRTEEPWAAKITTMVRERVQALALAAKSAQPLPPDSFSTDFVQIDALGRLRIECRVDDERFFDALYLRSLGGELEVRADGYGHFVAWVPPAGIQALAKRPDVRIIRHVNPPFTDTGSVNSEGDAGHNANQARALLGLTGAGQLVGVISDGVTNLAASQALGDLPATVTVPGGCTGSGDEGTAMLEIVNDLAPNAALAFCGGGGGTAGMINAITTLAAIPGITIITDDLPHPQEPLFEDGPIAQAKQAAFAAGIFYTCSAGNRALEHYQGNFNCTGGNITIGPNTYECPHDFGGGDRRLRIQVGTGGSATIYLQWAEAFGAAATDLDLYLLDTAGNVLASSTDTQNGTQDPAETATVNVPSGTFVDIVVDYVGGGSAPTVFFDLRGFGSRFQEFNTPAGSINGASRQTEVYAAAAAQWSTPATIENFSSRGPIRHFFPAQLTRNKPDGTGLDGVTVTGAGCFACPNPCPPITTCNFFGTSAATPHVAGVAALLLEMRPTLTPAQVAQVLNDTAVDIDAPGYDLNAGFGRVDALAAACTGDTQAPEVIIQLDGEVPAADDDCTIRVYFSGTAADDRCLQMFGLAVSFELTPGSGAVSGSVVEYGEIEGGFSFAGWVEVRDLTACPTPLQIRMTATDCCDNVGSAVVTATLTDSTPPQATCSATGGAVDDNCEFLATFSAQLTDNCCLRADDVDVQVDLPTGNAQLGPVQLQLDATSDRTIQVTGSVRVSQLTSCPATVRVTVQATDCCGNAVTCVATADVVDVKPPQITCPPDTYFEHGSYICEPGILDWLNSAFATDNCDPDVQITNDAPLCGFPYGSTTTVTWTATDDCGNTATCSATITIAPPGRGQPGQKGSLLFFPSVEVKWNGAGQVTQDTFIQISNDASSDVRVQMYFVHGDKPLAAAGGERAHPGWNWFDVNIGLTHNEPTYWSVRTGDPKGVSPFTVLDPGNPPGRPDPDGPPGSRMLRGYIVAWVVNNAGHEIRWNHLTGVATVVDYARGAAWEYGAWAFTTTCVDQGQEPEDCITADGNGVCCDSEVIAGRIDFDAFQYDMGPNRLLLNFFATNAQAFSRPGGPTITHNTDLTLVVLDQDLRQDHAPPVKTKVQPQIWNQNETSFAGTTRCITLWEQSLLPVYGNLFLRANLQTNAGRARLDGVGSTQCPGSEDTPLLGVENRILVFSNGKYELTGETLQITGTEFAQLRYDLPSPPEEKNHKP